MTHTLSRYGRQAWRLSRVATSPAPHFKYREPGRRHSETPGISRMTLSSTAMTPCRAGLKQLYKLINVTRSSSRRHTAVTRELALIR